MAALSLAELGRLAKVVTDRSTVAPGDLVSAYLVLPLPNENILLGNSAYAVSVLWRVTKTDPNEDADGTVTTVPAPPAAALGTEYVAPGGVNQLQAAFGLMPAVASVATTPYWLIARLTITWTSDATLLGAINPQGNVQQLVIEKSSGEIDAQGLSVAELVNRVLGLFKIEMPATPVEPGAALTARLRPRGAEDSEWNVESASSVVPKYELAAKVKLDPLFKPIGRIVNGIFGVANQITGAAVRVLVPVVKVLAAIEAGIQAVATFGSKLLGRKNPLRRVNPARELEALVRRIRIRNIDLFKNLELPIDASLLNRDFTTNLVPKDAIPPLPGPKGLLPTIPSLEQQLELSDQMPPQLTTIPVVGDLEVPFSLQEVAWRLWRPDVTLVAGAIPANAPTFQLVGGDAKKLPTQTPFWMAVFAATDDPENPAGPFEIVRVNAIGVSDADTIAVTRQQWGSGPTVFPAGATHRMRLLPLSRLLPGPQGEQKTILQPLSIAEVTVRAVGATIDYSGPALPGVTPFWVVRWNGIALDPFADPNAQVIQVTGHDPVAKQLTAWVGGQYGTPAGAIAVGNKLRVAPLTPAVTVAQAYGNNERAINLVAGDTARLPRAPFYAVWWNTTAFSAPSADPDAELVHVTNITGNALTVTRQLHRIGMADAVHNAPNTVYRLHVLADYYEVANTAATLLRKGMLIEPPVEPEGLVNLEVTLDTIIDPAGTNVTRAITLPPVPVRLVGLNPLELVAQQLELTAPVAAVEPGDEFAMQMGTSLPIETLSPNAISAPISIGSLPSYALPITVQWEILGENGEPLAEGSDYNIGGTATAVSVFFTPVLQILRRDTPVPLTRYIRVRLSTHSPRLSYVLGPLSIPVLPLQIPAFVALFRETFFQATAQDAVQVLLPSYYVTQTPSWVEDWETFKTRLNELQDRVASLLALSGGVPNAPLSGGSRQRLSASAVRRLTLIRGAIDYVANRATTGKLAFMPGRGGAYYAGYFLEWFPWPPQLRFTPGLLSDPFDNATTIVVVNDAPTTIRWQDPNTLPPWWPQATVGCSAQNPMCIVWRSPPPGIFGIGAGVSWIPREPDWDDFQGETVDVAPNPEWTVLGQIQMPFDQLAVTRWFPSMAANWSTPLE